MKGLSCTLLDSFKLHKLLFIYLFVLILHISAVEEVSQIFNCFLSNDMTDVIAVCVKLNTQRIRSGTGFQEPFTV